MATVTSTMRIGPADNGRLMSLDEFGETEVEVGYRYELARGVLEVFEVPNEAHGSIVWFILQYIADYDRKYPGVIYRAGCGSECRLLLPGMISVRDPDVAVALCITPKNLRGRRPPSLVFEVVSEGAEDRARDYVAKRAEYLAYGLREYWIVDLQLKAVTVLVRDGDGWVEQVYRDDQQATGLVLPRFAITVSELLSDEKQEESSDSEQTSNEAD
jgi:Uma2 family endonuclease